MWLLLFHIFYYGVFVAFFIKILLHLYLDLTNDSISFWDMGIDAKLIFRKYNYDESGGREKIKRICNFLYLIYAIGIIPAVLINAIIEEFIK